MLPAASNSAADTEEGAANDIASSQLRILVVDDHAVMRDGLSLRIESDRNLRVVGCVGSGKEAIDAAQRLRPDLIIMDLVLPSINGIDAISRILKVLPRTFVVAFSVCHSLEQVRRAMRAGAHAFVLKSAAAHELMEAITAVVAGQVYFCQETIALHGAPSLEGASTPNPIETLSERERQILQCIVAGMTSVEIGEKLSLSCKTVETYRGRMMCKLGVAHRTALIRAAHEFELPEP
jgi:two-component system nitrate/nitrite response regulator NarL